MYRLPGLAENLSLGLYKMNAFDFSNKASDSSKNFRLEAFSFTFSLGLNIYFDDMDDLRDIIGDTEIEFWQVEGLREDTYMNVDNFKDLVAAIELIMEGHLKDAQLKYLQAQINPHFLFNTLNAGAQLAMMEGADKTCLFVENMAEFFRYNLKKISQDATIEEEINLVDSYVYILNVRFVGEIRFQKRIEWLGLYSFFQRPSVCCPFQ